MRSMIPKEEIGALDFIRKYPECDGRGIIIAIWDTGVDPTARGLQVTSDGKPKVLDFIDASGSGDVKMLDTFTITATERRITSPSGRIITIPDAWKPVDGIIRVGVKSAVELFPSLLLDTIQNNATDRFWRPTLQRLSTYLKEATERLSTNCQIPARTDGVAASLRDATAPPSSNDTKEAEISGGGEQDGETCGSNGIGASPAANFSPCNNEDRRPPLASAAPTTPPSPPAEPREADKPASPTPPPPHPDAPPNFATLKEWLDSLPKESQATSVREMERVLAALNANNDFHPPVFDCFVFKGVDGDFVACIDTSPYEETPTTLADLPLMKDFTVDRQVGMFGNDSLLYYTVKIRDDGEIIQIVTNSGSHGTHVASIAAACFPEGTSTTEGVCPDIDSGNYNGIAPGAQIVSIKIGDTHLQSMETNLALMQAINWTTRLKCDVVNYSYGEKAFLPAFGRIYTHLTQFVLQTNIAFVSSGGNNGPALGTVGSPGGSVDGIIGVAPLVFPKMMEFMYCQPTCCNQKNVSTNQDTDKQMSAIGEGPAASAYTWGSRGPCADGSLGLTVAACGAAVADVAAWRCNAFDLLNGSSMSSPSVAGGVALVLSALRQCQSDKSLQVPFILWRSAIFSTAKPLPHLTPLDQGAGLFQVEAAFENLRSAITVPPPPPMTQLLVHSVDSSSAMIRLESPTTPSKQNLSLSSSSSALPLDSSCSLDRYSGWRLGCSVTGPGCLPENSRQLTSRGIWLRRGWLPFLREAETRPHPQMAFNVHLDPHFCQNISSDFMRDFNLNLRVRVGYNPPFADMPKWLSVAPYVFTSSKRRSFPLFIDPAQFPHEAANPQREFNPPSVVHHTCLSFVSLDQEHVLAHLPITIQLPQRCTLDPHNGVYRFGVAGEFTFTNKVCRWFVHVPRGATAGVFRIRRIDREGDAPCSFTISLVQPQSFGSCRGTGFEVASRAVNLCAEGSGGVGISGGRPELAQTFDLTSGEHVIPFNVPPGTLETLEVTVAQSHGANNPARCAVAGAIQFHGLEHSAQMYFPVHIRSNFGLESIRWAAEATDFVLPLRPSAFLRSYKKLYNYGNGCAGLPGVHVLRLEYAFCCPFRCDRALFDFTRLTSLLYEADVVQLAYHVYDSCGRFLGAGSYQTSESPKYHFRLSRGQFKLVAQILYADTKKLIYESPECDALDKLVRYPLLAVFPLPSYPVAGASTSDSNGPQLALEISTSLATLGLSGVDYNRSYRSINSRVGGQQDAEEANLRCPPCNKERKDPFFGSLQQSIAVPSHLSAGDCVTEIFGIEDERLAAYAIPGSMFHGKLHFYEHLSLRYVVPCKLVIHVGPRADVKPTTQVALAKNHAATAPAANGGACALGLTPLDLQRISWLATAFFGGSVATGVGWNSKPVQVPKKKTKKPNNGTDSSTFSEAPKSEKEKQSSSIDSCLEALVSADDPFNADRQAVWKDVNEAMKCLCDKAATLVQPNNETDLARHLLPIEVSMDDAEGDAVALLVKKMTPPNEDQEKEVVVEDQKKDEVAIESVSAIASNDSAQERLLVPPDSMPEKDLLTAKNASAASKKMASSVVFTSTAVIEALCIYGRHLCERTLTATATNHQSLLLVALEAVIGRLTTLTAAFVKPKASSAASGPSSYEAMLIAATHINDLKLKTLLVSFYTTVLFVHGCKMPLLVVLIKLAFQHLRRMGLGVLGDRLASQLPSRFSAFDYTLVIPRPLPPPATSQQQQQPNSPK